jgi:uncharacterized surface protein with fasciclin (FAS1) repeats
MLLRLILALLAVLFAGAMSVHAQEATEAAISPETTAHLRIAHLSPDAPPVNITIEGLEGNMETLSYLSVSDWIAVPVGSQNITITPGGNGEAGVNPLGAAALDLAGGQWNTLAIVGSMENGTLGAQLIPQDMSGLVPGTSRVTFIHAIENGPAVNINRDGVPFVTQLAYPGVASLNIDSGDYNFELVTADESATPVTNAEGLDIRESYDYLIVATGGDTPELFVHETDPAEMAIAAGELAEPGTIVEALGNQQLMGDIGSALQSAGLSETLAGEGPFTVFVPAEFVVDGSIDSAALADTLRYHVVEGELMTRDLVEGGTLPTLQGGNLNVREDANGIYVNDAQVITANIPATNGVIHIINGVLSPDGTTAASGGAQGDTAGADAQATETVVG